MALGLMGLERSHCSWFWVLWILGTWHVVMGLLPCDFPAIYNFGDSNSDTGGISAAFLQVPPPNGEAFFGRPSPFGEAVRRAAHHRLHCNYIIVMTAEHLGLPYLSAYLDSVGTNFHTGANFATGGSTIRPQNETLFQSGVSPFSLNVQLWQFDQFKARTSELYYEAKNASDRSKLPNPRDISRALYAFDIGQNDLGVGLRRMSEDQLRASIPDILDQLSLTLEKLYQRGARTFWIHNIGPIGCLPLPRTFFAAKPGLLDLYGCIKPHNDIAMEFNNQLKQRVIQLRSLLSHAALTYVDVYTAKYALISQAQKQGFENPLRFCCGHYEGYHVGCGEKVYINGTEVFGGSCGNPSAYISWDGIHYSQAANHWISNHILNGSLSDPPVPISESCYKHKP